jgi:MFS transporter, DHA2 family, multidrug resistance protein
MAINTSKRWWVLGAISIAVLAITLDVTVLTLALPTLAGALAATESQLQWFVTAYTLALAAGMLPMGFLGDRYGRKAVIIIGLLLFMGGSFACAYAHAPWFFILARIVLAVAGAAVIVVALSMLTVLFTKEERPRAIGVWSAANFLGLPLGPIVGGWILAHAWWGWIFLMNVPIALIALVAVAAMVPETRAEDAPNVDLVGLMLSAVGLVAFMYGTIKAGENGWLSASAIVPMVAGVAVILGFGFWERAVARSGTRRPLVDLNLFRSRSFTWGVILTAMGALSMFGVMFALPQYYQAIRGLDPQATGFRLLPMVAGLIVGAFPSDRIAGRIGAKATVGSGLVVAAVGSFIGMGTAEASGTWFVAMWTFIVGAGCGIAFATAASAAMVEVPEERSGIGSGLLQAIVKVGPAFGASILGSILNNGYRNAVDVAALPAQAAQAVKSSVFAGVAISRKLGVASLLDSVHRAFVSAMDRAIMGAAFVALGSAVLAVIFLSPRRATAPTARRTHAET